MDSDTILPPVSKKPKMTSSPIGLNADDTAVDATGVGKICVSICAEEAEKLGGPPTKMNAATAASTTSTSTTPLLQLPGPIVGVTSSSSAAPPVNTSPTTTVIVITTTLVVTTATKHNKNSFQGILDNPLLRTNITTRLSNEDLMRLACVSKHTNRNIPRATSYESRALGTIIPVLSLHPSASGESRGRRGRFDRWVKKVHRRRLNNPSLFQQYQHLSMQDYYELQFNEHSSIRKAVMEGFKTYGPRIEGITSLDFRFSTTTTGTKTATRQRRLLDNNGLIADWQEKPSVLELLSHVLPSLREIDFTNMIVSKKVMREFFKNCPNLEKLTHRNNAARHKSLLRRETPALSLTGADIAAGRNLKELQMDDSWFFIDKSTLDAMENLDTDTDYERVSKTFLFHECRSKVLERVSVRNAKVHVKLTNHIDIAAIPQRALMKFIRNAPATMCWFRSDLTLENIEILRTERPEIEFVQ